MPEVEATHADSDAPDSHDDHGSGHAHATREPLGPIDVTAWAWALAGAAVGLVVALAMFVARGG